MNPESHFRTVAPLHMRQLLKDFPELGDLDAAAVFGNAGHESKGLTDDQEDKPTVKGSRGGLNWMQWTGPRRKDMEAYCARNHFDPTSDEAAYKWLFLEMKGEERKAIPALLAATTLEDKVKAFEAAFLRAGVKHYPSRLKWAQIALEELRRPAAIAPTPLPRPVPLPFPDDGLPADPTGALPPSAPPRTGKGWGCLGWSIFGLVVVAGLVAAAFIVPLPF